MKLSKLQRKLNEEKLSSSDNKIMKRMRDEIKDYIRDENLDEMNISGADFLDYSRKLKDKINNLIEDKELNDSKEVENQLYNFFEIK